MLSKFFLFIIFSWIIGNPLVAILILFLVYFFLDRAYLGLLPDPFLFLRSARRIGELKKQVALNPHDARSLKELGILLEDKGRHDEAIDYFVRAASKMSEDAEFNYYFGIAHARSGNVGRGRELIDAAVRQSPALKYGDPYLMMAEVYMGQDDYVSALPLLEKFEGIHSSSTRGLYQMGLCLIKLGRRDEGVKYLHRSVSAFQSSPRFKRKKERKWVWKARALLRRHG